ncbi:exonuclease subunit SbcD [Demequina sp. NBRC 110052]|uniref:metallophosphoesterase family protein n=1 Tax=Demequina sp. NBRC 110052 TaxID=1570341 RepID=UPI000A03E306|nr:exonuclease subunit SbcD [Demequina sp. NBRC 110052]
MRLLHTSDWHIGRTFHGHSTDEHLAQVLAAIAVAVAEHGVDAVIVAGDIFDTSTPKADAFTMLGDAVRAIREAGATVILTSGNHDGPQRLGHMAEFASFGGVHVRTEVAALAEPVTLTDEHGDVLVYGIPYLHPEFVRAAFPESDARTHAPRRTHIGPSHGEAGQSQYLRGARAAEWGARAGTDAPSWRRPGLQPRTKPLRGGESPSLRPLVR